jgi:hypothetical protein
LSRTDAHAPSHIRLARGDLSARQWHAAVHDACDLPALEATVRYGKRTTGCYWAFFYTGVSECSCPSCHGGPQAHARNRAERHRDRAALHTALDAWRGGDDTAFDALVPPSVR